MPMKSECSDDKSGAPANGFVHVSGLQEGQTLSASSAPLGVAERRAEALGNRTSEELEIEVFFYSEVIISYHAFLFINKFFAR